jgi:SAM-dependent methyltransferase
VNPTNDISDFADQNPSSEVIGTDLSDTMPSWVPPNCRFELDDAELDWTYAPNSFDFIHMRYLMGAIGDFPRLYEQVFKALKPGGWIEHMELSVIFECDDGSLSDDNPLRKWAPLQIEASETMGKTFRVGEYTKSRLKAAGYVDVKEHKFKLPVGPWSSDKKMKEIGNWNLYFFLRDTEGFCVYLLGKVMGVSRSFFSRGDKVS